VKFILTPELGRLCRWLRILGYDAYYFRGRDSSLLIKALQEHRIIVTRRRKLAEESAVRKVIIHHDKLKDQLRELKENLGLDLSSNNLFSRCAECNAEVKRVEKEVVKNKVPEYVYQTQNEFYKCPKCKRIFWQGTHWNLAQKYLGELLDDSG
jgi:hypothetical protein